MQNVQKGFTLIELVVVIVLLGILGVTALAKFQDLSTEAENAANAGVAAELSGGSNINYAARKMNVANGFQTSGAQCEAIAGDVLAASVAGYSWTGVCGADGTTMQCSVSGGGTTPGVATILCID